MIGKEAKELLASPVVMRVRDHEADYTFHAAFANVDKSNVRFTTLNYIDPYYFMPKGHEFDVNSARVDADKNILMDTSRGMVTVIFDKYDEDMSDAKKVYSAYLKSNKTTHAKERAKQLA